MMHPPRGTRRSTKKLLTVRFPVPRAAATILRSMAVSKDPRLLELGVMAVQFKDNERIALGLGVEKEPWEKDEELQEPGGVRRNKTREVLAHFSDEVELLSSNLDRHNTASKHNSRDVIYAGNGSCSNNNNPSVEEKTSQLKLNLGEGSFNPSSETRSRVVEGIRPNLNLERITRKQASDLHSETTSRSQSNIPPGRILPPLPRRKRDAGSPGSTKSELSKRGKGTKPMLDIFFDQGRFSAASMLMQLAKNHTSKGDTETQEREGIKHSATIDSDEPVMTSISTSTNKVRIVSQTSPHKIPQCQKITVELMEDEEMGSSTSGDSPAPVVPSKSTTGTPRNNYAHYEKKNPGIGSKQHDIISDSQASTDNGSSYVHCMDIPKIWSGHHISPIHPGNNASTQSHTDSAPSQTVWSNPSVLLNSQAAHGSPKGNADTQIAWSNSSVLSNSHAAHGSCHQMSKGNADTQIAWSNSSLLSNSQAAHGSCHQMSKGNADTQLAWSNSSLLSNSQAARGSCDQISKGNADTQIAWSNPSVLSNSQATHGSLDQMSKGNADTQIAWSNPSVLSNSQATHGSLDQMSKRNADTKIAWSNPSVLLNSQAALGSCDQIPKGSADTQTTWSNPSVRPHTQCDVRQPAKGSDDVQTTGAHPCVPSNSVVADQEEMDRGVNTLTTWSSNPDISTNVINAQPQLGLYQQNIARYPVSYVTYPVGFVYPFITLPRGGNAVSGQDSEVKDEPEKKEQSEETLAKPSVINHTEQEQDSSTRTPSTNTSTVQWVIPQVQAGGVVQQGQFIDLASSLRYWQQLSLLYRNQYQAAAAQALAQRMSAITSSPAGPPQNTAAHSKGNEIEKLLGKESHDINNNLTVGCDKSAGNEGNQSQAGFKSHNSLSSFEVKQSSDQRLGKSQSISPVFGSTVNTMSGRASVIHVVEPNENKGTSRNAPGSSNQHMWGHSARYLSDKPERSKDWLGISKTYSSSAATSCSKDTSSQAPATKELYNPMFPVQKPSSRFGEPHGLLREVERGSAPELSFVHENSIAYMNVRSHSDYGSKDLKNAASRSEEGVRPAKRRKSKKSL